MEYTQLTLNAPEISIARSMRYWHSKTDIYVCTYIHVYMWQIRLTQEETSAHQANCIMYEVGKLDVYNMIVSI
jgi:heterodisulfide reductase subunit B